MYYIQKQYRHNISNAANVWINHATKEKINESIMKHYELSESRLACC